MRLIDVRQPRPHDVVASRSVIAGVGSGCEGTVVWRVVILDDPDVIRPGQVVRVPVL